MCAFIPRLFENTQHDGGDTGHDGQEHRLRRSAPYIRTQQPDSPYMSSALTTRLNGLLLSIDEYLGSENVSEDDKQWQNNSIKCYISVNRNYSDSQSCDQIERKTGATNVFQFMKISVKINYSLNNKTKRCLLTSLEFPNGNSYGRTYSMNESAQEIWYNSIMKSNFSPYLIYWSGTYPEILPDELSVCVGQFLRVEFGRPILQTSNR